MLGGKLETRKVRSLANSTGGVTGKELAGEMHMKCKMILNLLLELRG